MRRRLVLLIMAAALTLVSGCAFPEAYPIEKEQNILIAGVDVNGDDIILTVLVDSVSAGGKAGEEQIKYKLFQTTAKTVFEADDMLHKFMEKRPSWNHTKYVLLGEEAARSGIDRLLSFFCEDDETRILYRIAVVKGMAAGDFLEQVNTPTEDLADYFDTLFSAVTQTGESRELHLINYAIHTQTPWVSVYMPVFDLNPNPVQSEGAKGSGGDTGPVERKDLVVLNGFALFDEDRLAGFMGGDISRGLNIITNDIDNSGLSIEDQQGNGVGLELIVSNSSIDPKFNPLSAAISVSVQFNLTEYHRIEPLNEKDILYLEQQANKRICDEIYKTIQCMQQLKSDPARIMDAFYHKDPVRWQSIKSDWKNIFSNLEINIEVNSKIMNTYELLKPVGK